MFNINFIVLLWHNIGGVSDLKSSKVKIAAIVTAVLILSGIASFAATVAFVGDRDIIFPGVRVADIDLGGLTQKGALDRVRDYENQLRDKTVVVSYNGERGEFKLKDVGFRLKAEELVEKAHIVGREGYLLDQWLERRRLAKKGREIPLAVTADKKKLSLVLNEITKAVRIPPQEARLVINQDDTINIIDSKDGYGVDSEAAWTRLMEIAVSNDENELPLQMVALRPARTTEDVRAMGINGVVAQFTTRFDIRKTNRVYNIRVAAQALDGTEVKPGQVFSFNKIVGPRSQAAGYKLAPTILNNEFVDSPGGGVCQVSTTLYNSLLLADLQIIQRSSHSLVVSYVPLGQDAAVSYGGKDLKFKNNYDSYLIIKSKVVGNTITFKLFGDIKNRKYVKVINTTIKEYPFKMVYKNDPTLPKGTQKIDQKGVRGYKVTSQRLVYSGGQLIKKEKLPISFYNPLDQIILVGTGKAPASGSTLPRPVTPVNPPAPDETPDPADPPVDPGQPPDSGTHVDPPPEDSTPQDDPQPPVDPGISPGQ